MRKHRKGSSLNERLSFDLPEERLASTSKTGERVYLYPAAVKGVFRQLRNSIYFLLVITFLGLPWTKINGSQAILLNITERKFAVFGLTFWAHETPILFFVLLSFILGIGFVTAMWGRIWCGWACPQTVFIDFFFRRIEEWIEGAGQTRRRFDQSPWTLKKGVKRTIKWILFLAAALLITHSFLAYFVGAEAVLEMVQASPSENIRPFLVILFTTGIILFNFGWFKEQFCIIACPYGRLQSVIMDEDSLVVAYDPNRGEPRKKDRKDTTATGDCINCYRCVQVCPTGVDIRRGTQMECIMCTACVDACDTIMTKLNKPKGLIRYSSENEMNQKKTIYVRVRTVIYATIFSIAVSGLVMALSTRNMVPVHTKRLSQTPYIVRGDFVENRFKFTVQNQHFNPIQVSFQTENAIQIVSPTPILSLLPGEKKDYIAFITLPKEMIISGKAKIVLTKIIMPSNQKEHMEVTLIGPLSQ